MDFKFTAHIEEELDEIANGEMDYHEMLEEFYPPFKEKVLAHNRKLPKEQQEKEFLEKIRQPENGFS